MLRLYKAPFIGRGKKSPNEFVIGISTLILFHLMGQFCWCSRFNKTLKVLEQFWWHFQKAKKLLVYWSLNAVNLAIYAAVTTLLDGDLEVPEVIKRVADDHDQVVETKENGKINTQSPKMKLFNFSFGSLNRDRVPCDD